MKRIRIILLVVLSIVLLSSQCGGPDMFVINEVQEDGSINRKLVISYDKDDLDLNNMQVPVDSTWTMDKNLEISEKGDSLWIVTAEKNFASVDELNKSYTMHTGANEKMNRWSVFEKKFRWFNTVYYFSENIEKAIEGYPPEDFFDEEYLGYFYMPEKIFNDLRYGEDSLKFKTVQDTLEDKKDVWLVRSLVRAAIFELDSLLLESGDEAIDINTIWAKEEELGGLVEEDLEHAIDTLFGEGYYTKHKVLIDSAMTKLEVKFDVAFSATSYLVQTNMPGELLGTNGYIDTDGGILWEVNGDVILSKDYEMWAESSVSNIWAWIISGLFVIFALVGLFLRKK